MTAAKIAVSVPRDTYAAVEKRRRALGISRSAVVTAALEAWLADETMTAEERRYLVAYLREPDTVSELHDAREVAAAAVSSWGSWDASAKKGRSAKAATKKKSRRRR